MTHENLDRMKEVLVRVLICQAVEMDLNEITMQV
jgi:hypothetical protein